MVCPTHVNNPHNLLKNIPSCHRHQYIRRRSSCRTFDAHTFYRLNLSHLHHHHKGPTMHLHPAHHLRRTSPRLRSPRRLLSPIPLGMGKLVAWSCQLRFHDVSGRGGSVPLLAFDGGAGDHPLHHHHAEIPGVAKPSVSDVAGSDLLSTVPHPRAVTSLGVDLDGLWHAEIGLDA